MTGWSDFSEHGTHSLSVSGPGGVEAPANFLTSWDKKLAIWPVQAATGILRQA